LSLNEVLKAAQRELKEKERVKQRVQEATRKATRLSKQAILLVHQKRFKEAKGLLTRAKRIIRRLIALSREYPEIVYSGLFDVALQEYCEANILFHLIRDSKFVSPEELEVPAVAYVLGLADVIGELRRVALDSLRTGDITDAEKCLERMDEVYTALMGMNDAYLLVSGLRRKCDVARRIIETTRGDVTLEARRNSLKERIQEFEELVKKRRRSSKR
jgi:translin